MFLLNQLINSTWAQGVTKAAADTATTRGPSPSPLTTLLPFILIFVVFYFFMIRPQKKKMQQEQSLLASLGKGDEIYTKSGMIGTIHGLTEKIITLEVSNGVHIKILRNQIGGTVSKLFESKDTANAKSKK